MCNNVTYYTYLLRAGCIITRVINITLLQHLLKFDVRYLFLLFIYYKYTQVNSGKVHQQNTGTVTYRVYDTITTGLL